MKKLLIAGLTAALILGTGTTSAFAARQGNGQGNGCCGTQTTCTSPDANKDGICDICGKQIGKNGNCKNNCGKNYVDADGDGVCDNYAANSSSCNNGRGQGQGRHRKHHR